MKKYLPILVLTFLLAISCEKDVILKDDELSLKRTNYPGNQLKIDGYYYYEYLDSADYIDVYFLFTNGILLYGSTFKKSELNNKEIEYTSLEWHSLVKTNKYRWGIFNISHDSVQFERWYPSDPPIKAYLRTGKIINDTTFVITESCRVKNGVKYERQEKNEIYRFKQFSPKPDSTNNFIK